MRADFSSEITLAKGNGSEFLRYLKKKNKKQKTFNLEFYTQQNFIFNMKANEDFSQIYSR